MLTSLSVQIHLNNAHMTLVTAFILVLLFMLLMVTCSAAAAAAITSCVVVMLSGQSTRDLPLLLNNCTSKSV